MYGKLNSLYNNPCKVQHSVDNKGDGTEDVEYSNRENSKAICSSLRVSIYIHQHPVVFTILSHTFVSFQNQEGEFLLGTAREEEFSNKIICKSTNEMNGKEDFQREKIQIVHEMMKFTFD